jgi:formylglycine-generating enzyme required for sulfatase activity
VPSGDFNRSCDDDCHRNCAMGNQDFPARVAPFALDAFEVTVGRFRRFVSHYPAAKPLPTAGANPKNAADVGWHEEWDALLPATQADLIAKLGSVSCDAWATWTDTEGSSEDLPINCVSWYVAQAFCIWDGGRLPTDAEWYYVASGGESRVYPWSHPPGEATIGKDYANYLPAGTGGPVAVGSYPSGRGRWQHYDLGGNVAEWVWDGLRDCYSSTDLCDNCGETDALPQKIVRGGYFNDDEQPLRTETRRAYTATDARSIVGFRCARGL